MNTIDIFKTRALKFRMTTFNRVPTELETGIWAVTGFSSLKEMDNSVALAKVDEASQKREKLRKEKPYANSESHIFSHRGNVIYPDGPLNTLLLFLKNIEPNNLYLYPENSDYKHLFFLIASSALNFAGLEYILNDLGYFSDELKRGRFSTLSKYVKEVKNPQLVTPEDLNKTKDELGRFIEQNYEKIQEKISRNVFTPKTGTEKYELLKGINISNKFDIGYVIDPSFDVIISYNDDYMNQGTIIEPKIDPKYIIGILLNSSRIEKLKSEKVVSSKKAFEKLATTHLATLRSFVDWFGEKNINMKIYMELFKFIKNIPESFFYMDTDSNIDSIFNEEEHVILNDAASDFLKEKSWFEDGQTLYDSICKICEKHNLSLYSSDGEILPLS